MTRRIDSLTEVRLEAEVVHRLEDELEHARERLASKARAARARGETLRDIAEASGYSTQRIHQMTGGKAEEE